MKTEDLLKELENEQHYDEASQQIDITQLQGAIILIQGNLAEQQRQIAELSKMVTAIKNSLDNNYSDVNKTLNELPNRINNTYSNAVSTLCNAIRDKTATESSGIEAITKATKALVEAQTNLKSSTLSVSKATELVQYIFKAYSRHDKKLIIEKALHYLFLLLFSFWLAYGRNQSYGNETLLALTIIIILLSVFSNIFIKER